MLARHSYTAGRIKVEFYITDDPARAGKNHVSTINDANCRTQLRRLLAKLTKWAVSKQGYRTLFYDTQQAGHHASSFYVNSTS